jgi:hypothetical protein
MEREMEARVEGMTVEGVVGHSSRGIGYRACGLRSSIGGSSGRAAANRIRAAVRSRTHAIRQQGMREGINVLIITFFRLLCITTDCCRHGGAQSMDAFVSGGLLTSDTTAQQQHHASVAACACTLLHSCVHAMGPLTWSVAAALPLCDARQFEFVRQRQAQRLRNGNSLPAHIAITIDLQQQ